MDRGEPEKAGNCSDADGGLSKNRSEAPGLLACALGYLRRRPP